MAALRVNAELAASDCTIVSTKNVAVNNCLTQYASYAVKRAHSVWTPLHSNSKAKKAKSKKGIVSLDTTAQ